jgi:predicted transposase YdaD
MAYEYLTKLPKPQFMVRFEQEAKAAGMAAGFEQGIKEGIEKGIERGIEQGIAAGIQAKALENARKLVEHGVSWEIITSATGVKPEDLEAK